MSAFVSITDAARYAGISRTTLYKKYIDTGVISVKKVNNYPKIDVADLLRVFGELKTSDSEQDLTLLNTSEQAYLDRISSLEKQISQLKSDNEKLLAINEAKDKHLADMRRGFDLIEYAAGRNKKWWRFWL